ncbi:carboxypeptidase-like regulatory domain-containing protein [Tundrisphaera sp. TA3]|uniref:carboxypeptidase-like regulatory domain-containing protein n=1 Tax=Tundrisphaera sp. TA3 TaxID=3435775 RepID=UPI003EB72D7E
MMVRALAFSPLSLGLLLGLALPGCGGDGIPRESVAGTVTLDGKPLESGTIRFLPSDPAATQTTADAPISGGKYAIPASQGLAPGSYLVSISSPVPGEDPTAKKRPAAKPEESGTGAIDAPVEPPMHDQIPRKYNINSTLKADVVKGQPNAFPFELTSK